MKYTKEWNRLTKLMGYWVDVESPYITYKNKYIETVWFFVRRDACAAGALVFSRILFSSKVPIPHQAYRDKAEDDEDASTTCPLISSSFQKKTSLKDSEETTTHEHEHEHHENHENTSQRASTHGWMTRTAS